VVTLAAKSWLPDVATPTDAGETAILTTRSAATFTVIDADFAMSARGCAVTMQSPVPRNELKTPAGVTDPQAAGADHSTVPSALPDTVALSVTGSHAKAGTGDTAVMVTPLSTVAVAWPLTAAFDALVATTWKTPEKAGAVYMPAVVTVPPLASETLQVTCVADDAVNNCVPRGGNRAAGGWTSMDAGFCSPCFPSSPQAAANIAATALVST
jgi:hypothetical protein